MDEIIADQCNGTRKFVMILKSIVNRAIIQDYYYYYLGISQCYRAHLKRPKLCIW